MCFIQKGAGVEPFGVKQLIRPSHTSHIVYCGSDNEYHYFTKAVVLARDRRYKLKRANLLVYGEFTVDESKCVLFSPPMNGAIYIEGYKR